MTTGLQFSLKAQNDLVLEYQNYADNIINKLIRLYNLPEYIYEDIYSVGYIGLVEASRRYRSDIGTSFQNYAYLRIRGSVIDFIRKNSPLKNQSKVRRQKLNNELSKADYKTQAQQKVMNVLNASCDTSLVFQLSQLKSGLIGNDQYQPENYQANTDLQERIKQAYRQISTKSKEIIYLRYVEDLSLIEIGERFGGYSKSWICRLHQQAIQELRNSYLELSDHV